jgi:UDP-N-acetylglucosamine--N-acetylmuramyl-(pentapeptide) pyrophosphoryl-undecaprenol N-acetylglucosamine transferase
LPTLASADLLWVGSRGGLEEEMVRRAGLEFVGLTAGGLRGVGLLTKVRNAIGIVGSLGKARDILARFQPDVVLVTGGYACVAVTVSAWMKGIPVLIYLPDIVPGLAIRFLGRFATKIAVTSEESYHYFRREKVTVTGYPVRPEIYTLDRASARQSLGLEPNGKALLVFGGSRGARSINQALIAGLRELLPACQIVHISGRLDADWVAGVAKGLPDELRARYHHLDYLHDMPPALVAADLAVARAGAATLGEFPAAGLPSVLVPYPYAGQHQQPNAIYMERNGAAHLLPDAELGQALVPTVLGLLEDEETLANLRESARAMARPDAAEAIAEELWSVARQHAIRTSLPPADGTDGRGTRS